MSDRPFKLCTTSFIFPDHYLPNVERLGRFFDEIELLVFESAPKEVLPSAREVRELLSAGEDLNLTYNVHLPTDVDLGCESLTERQKAADTLLQVLHLFAPLHPTSFTLHLELPDGLRQEPVNLARLEQWRDRVRTGLSRMVQEVADPSRILIETLDYQFAFVDALVTEFSLGVCLDIGHGIRFGYDFAAVFETHGHRTPLIHLHGVAQNKENFRDHVSLDALKTEQRERVLGVLEQFSGVVSLEVFNLENLNRSLGFLSSRFPGIPDRISDS